MGNNPAVRLIPARREFAMYSLLWLDLANGNGG